MDKREAKFKWKIVRILRSRRKERQVKKMKERRK